MKKKSIWKVYQYTNKENGKIYIGNTAQSLKARAGNDGCGYKIKNGGKFYEAIQKYGWDNFESNILKDGITNRKDAFEIERSYIIELNSIENGYNEIENYCSNNKDKTWKWDISDKRKEEIKISKSKSVICGGEVYNSVEELSSKVGISKGTLYGWLSRETEFINSSEERDYYLKELGLKYYDEFFELNSIDNCSLCNNKKLLNDVDIQEKRILINKHLISIYQKIEDLIKIETEDNNITNGENSNYFYLKNVIDKILKL